MLIDCPGCAKSYHISRAALEPEGRDVACPRCAAVWFVAIDGGQGPAADTEAREISAEAISQKPVAAPVAEDAAKELQVENGRTPAYPPLPRLKISQTVLLSLAIFGLLTAGLGWRKPIVRLWPQAATAYAALGLPVNLRGLSVHDLHLTRIEGGTEPVLGIEGEITNLKSEKNHIPVLRLSLRDEQSREVYAWTIEAPKSSLTTGETLSFRARLAAPPVAATSLLVSFAPAAHESLALLQ
jgi:predicted Zn finger-like uncharacterized protein